MNEERGYLVEDQLLAALGLLLKVTRDKACELKVATQADLLDQACACISNAREFIDRPGNILGATATKHGEIAEVIEISCRNAWSLFNSVEISAFEHPDRFGPVDYIIDGVDVQSKFHNGARSTLADGIKVHLEKYPEFAPQGGVYAVPKDQYETILKVLRGEESGLSSKSVDAIRKHVKDIEESSGRSFQDVVRPASYTYKEVQHGVVDKTLDEKQGELIHAHDERVDEIRDQHRPTWNEGMKAAGVAAGVGAGVAFVRTTYSKYQEGRNLFKGEFTAEDWLDVGLDTGKGALIGGVTGGTLYFMTNCARMSAPMAGAMVSAAKGIAPLVEGYRNGSLSMEQLIDSSCMAFAEVGMVAAATAVGQAVIPLPVVGALVGSIAGQAMASVLANQVVGAEAAIHARLAIFRAALSSKQQVELDQMKARFEHLGDLTAAAFDVKLNADILCASARLASAYGVSQEKLLLTVDDVDRFVLA